MFIRSIKGATQSEIVDALRVAIARSRFTADVETPNNRAIKIVNVRLKTKKHYCGNHPNACEGVGERHCKRNYLEGADWVEFNDLINSVRQAQRVGQRCYIHVHLAQGQQSPGSL